jgi:hypothetical protein
MTSDRNAYSLALLADVASPDSLESPGALWLTRIESAAANLLEECAELGGDPVDAIHETADAIVPIYTHERWSVFTDLAAYNEDVTDYGPDYSDLTAVAGVALYVVAERLLSILVDEAGNGDDA